MAVPTVNSSIAAPLNFVCLRGDSFTAQLALYYEDGSPRDLAGLGFLMHVIHPYSGVVLMTFSNEEAGDITVDGHLLTLRKPAADMRLLQTAKYRYDVQEKAYNGPTFTFLKGQFIVEEDATQ